MVNNPQSFNHPASDPESSPCSTNTASLPPNTNDSPKYIITRDIAAVVAGTAARGGITARILESTHTPCKE